MKTEINESIIYTYKQKDDYGYPQDDSWGFVIHNPDCPPLFSCEFETTEDYALELALETLEFHNNKA